MNEEHRQKGARCGPRPPPRPHLLGPARARTTSRCGGVSAASSEERSMNVTAESADPAPRTRGAGLGPYRVLRGHRDLALLFGGQVVSAIGDWLYITALIVI